MQPTRVSCLNVSQKSHNMIEAANDGPDHRVEWLYNEASGYAMTCSPTKLRTWRHLKAEDVSLTLTLKPKP